MNTVQKHITDGFGRRHNYLRISLTERCNLRCFYCMPEEGVSLRDKSEFMTAEETLEIAKTFVDLGVTKIRLTGGEPLIKKNADLIIRELGKLPVELAITTNGILVDRYIDTFKEAGMKSINVSLDSLKEERFNTISRREYFHRIMQNIELLIENGFDVKINMVVIRNTNEDEISDFVQWTIDKKIHVQFIEFMPFDGNRWNTERTISFEEIMQYVTERFGREQIIKIADQPNDTARSYQIRGAKGSFGIISTVTNPFCDSCNRIRLTADGKVKNCLFSNSETDLLSTLRSGKEIVPLIHQSVAHKFKERAGIETFSDQTMGSHKNRSMITIGG